MCPVALDRHREAWIWRFRMEHGIPEETAAKATTPEAMLEVLSSIPGVIRG
jgi:hypothetical protein